MTGVEAKRYIIGAMAAAGVVGSVSSFVKGHAPRLRIFLGIFVAGAVLAMLAEASPDLAGAFALLFLVAAILSAGPEVFDKVTGVVRGLPPATPAVEGKSGLDPKSGQAGGGAGGGGGSSW